MTRESTLTMVAPVAPVAELVDASDLKSLDPKGSCRFESGRGHQSAGSAVNINTNLKLRSAPMERVSKHGHEHLAGCPSFETVAEFTPRYSRGDLLRMRGCGST